MDSAVWQLTGIFFLSWLSEDAAVLGGALAASTGSLPALPCFLTCVAGLWSGDLLLFSIARLGGRPLTERFFGHKETWFSRMRKSEAWFADRGVMALVISRFVPGLRLTTFLAAGFLKMKAVLFALVTGVMSAFWALLAFVLVHLLGKAAPEAFRTLRGHLYLIIGGVLLFVLLIRFLPPLLQRIARWEFWPAWLFYLPVAFHYLCLAIRHRGLTLPSSANPGMVTGGLIGDSKDKALAEIASRHPEHVARTFLLPTESTRQELLLSLLESGEFPFPLVMKPDVGQRGGGFRLIRNREEAEAYVSSFPAPLVIQEYLPGPLEAGVFYHRHPEEETGRILAITWKEFPSVRGDGRRTLKQLIQDDPRASLIAGTYLRRFAERLDEMPAMGESVRLVEAGNHCQGCIFKDGTHLATQPLVAKFDAISKSMTGFFVGRYDVRFADADAFMKGEGFKILEVNGAAAEATAAYDPEKSLFEAYRLIFRQWSLVFEIGAANRARGNQPDSIGTIMTEWRRYSAQSRFHPPTH
jgi:membrane protein DedA with SNARE-associated domain